MAERSQAAVALGEAIRELRDEREISQEHLGDITGLNRNHVGKIERGQQSPTYDSIRKIANGLAIPTAELVARAERFERDANAR